jgi:hypothetical protein
LLLALSPLALDDSYSWVEHTTSEAGGQGVSGAWVARAGFVLFGLAAVLIAWANHKVWGRLATGFHGAFGVLMFAVAVFSLRSWDTELPFDRTEDALHSVAATLMGFAFAFGVVFVSLRARNDGRLGRRLDVVAVMASVVLPIGMSLAGSPSGALQRLMFAIAYLWYGREALRLVSEPDASVASTPAATVH